MRGSGVRETSLNSLMQPFCTFFLCWKMCGYVSNGLNATLECLILSVRTHHRLPKANEKLFCWLKIQGQQQRERAA